MKTNYVRTKVVASLLALAALAWFCFTAGGGSLEPNTAPAPTMRTLDEIYTAASSGSDSGQVSGTEFAADDRNFIAMVVTGIPGSGIPGVSELEDACKVLDVEHALTRSYNPATCSVGSEQHSPISIIKNIDKASPGLHKALCTGQVITEVTIYWYRTDPNAAGEAYYKITLTDAVVVEIGPTTNFVTPDDYKHMEKVSFVYSRIEWNWVPDSIFEQDQPCGQ